MANIMLGFQSTLPQGERHCQGKISRAAEYFNPRSHKGSDGIANYSYTDGFGFQSTLPQGERRYMDQGYQIMNIFQSTLPQGERRCPYFLFVMSLKISIHAPTRGATVWLADPETVKAISIHAPTRGATGKTRMAAGIANISIHAPTRGATGM